MPRTNNEVEIRLGVVGCRFISLVAVCSACGAKYGMPCYDLDDKTKVKLLGDRIHRARYYDGKDGLNEFTKAVENHEMNESPYVAPASDKKTEKIGNIRI